MNIQINRYIPVSEVEGPNKRFVMWLQGCSIRCKDCANSDMWNKEGGTVYDVKNIIELIKNYSSKIEGITFLGGEPLDQLEAVKYICKQSQNMGLSVVVFTGYEYENIKNKPEIKELINYIDILIDGKFDSSKKDFSRPWVGSTNQKYHFFSDKYNESILTKYKNKFELRVDEKNKIFINGMGDYFKLTDIVR